MATREAPRVAISALGQAKAKTLVFRVGGQLRVAAVVKAGFVLAPDGPMLLTAPEPLVDRDRHHDRDPGRSLLAASDLVPYRPRADVLLTGHARAPVGWPTARLGLRVMVARGPELLLDKRLAAQGPPDEHGAPTPFTSIPLEYERAAHGADDNPAGVAAESGAWPGIVDRWHRAEPVGFGPIAARWPTRRRLLRDPEALRAPIPALPADFAWEYFNAAPPDQQIAFLHGDEWVGFEGMNSQLPRVQSYLPGARGVAKLYGPEPGLQAGRAIALVADTLTIDADRLRVSLVWRGSFAVSSEAALASLRVFAGVETATEPLVFPASYDDALVPALARARADDPFTTLEMSPCSIEEARDAPSLPFAPHAPLPPREPPAHPLPPATPFDHLALWGSLPSRTPIPPPPGVGEAAATSTIELSGELARMLRAAALPFAPPAPPPLREVPEQPLRTATPFEGAAEIPIAPSAEVREVGSEASGADAEAAPQAAAPASPPKTLGENFLAAIACVQKGAGVRGGTRP
jgi:hypothetical protein